ncbi:MAG: bacteriohemerythrin [Treponema sp.]
MIKKIEWSDSYALGIPEIDAQHKKLLAIANELYNTATGTEQSFRLDMAKVLRRLTDYTVYHFSAEEAFMRSYGYEESDGHKALHDGFIAEINSQIQKLGTGSREDALRFYVYIANWVLSHIAKSDKMWADFVKKQQS